ncbi:MAG: hypothetical protein QOG16_1602, partial [Actinomycetota bacterium]|nr:hypothetical protein [Actinomycetota bacterium]
MDMPEVSPSRLHVFYVTQEILTSTLGLSGQRVVTELGYRRRYVRTEYVDLTETLHLGSHLLFSDLSGDVKGGWYSAA